MTRSRGVWLTVLLVGIVAVPASAQRTPAPGARAAVLRGRIEEQFVRRVKQELGLNDEAAQRMQRVVNTWAGRRRALEAEERQFRLTLNSQLRPGVAANPDSVDAAVEGLTANRVAYAQSFRDEMHELAPILTPVQRGQFQLLRDRLLLRVQEIQQGQRADAP
ncbi:MAG: Spy/CpxP family protein refolding chaperone [Gemmatimonadota bacterium]